MSEKSAYKRFLRVGPGGVKCPCCFPAPGSPERKYEFKRARRAMKEALKREIKEQEAEE